MRRTGIATWAFTDITFAEKFLMVADMGYTAASVLGEFFDNMTPEELEDAEEALRDTGIVITVHLNFGIPKIDPQDMLGRLERILKWNDKTGYVAIVSYDVPKVEIAPGKYEPDYPGIRETFGKALEISAGKGPMLLLEDCPLDADELANLGDWREKYPHWGILVDLGHMNLRLRRASGRQPSFEDMEDYLRRIPAPIRELHIHGNDGEKDEHLPPYMGNADIESYAEILDSMGFDGIATIEAMPWWCKGNQEQMEKDAKDSLKFWNDFMSKDG